MSILDFLGPADSPFQAFKRIFDNGGFIIFFPLYLWVSYVLWMEWVQNYYRGKKKFVLLAIDVPKANEQSMKAVEQILATLHAVEYGPNKKEKYWIGFIQDFFALELVSIDGYIQYFIRCDNYNVDMVKGAVFAQYPDAEIVEVEDYVLNVPQTFPNDTHDLFGMEIILNKPDPLPIKTYEFFEDKLTGTFADPMAALLETMSRMRPGEQMWIQILITPQNATFRVKGVKMVNDLIGKKIAGPKTWVDRLVNVPLGLLNTAVEQITNSPMTNPATEPVDSQGNFLNMTTGEKIVVEELQKKMSRLLYRTKMRFVYLAHKDALEIGRAASPVYGAIKQFNTLDLNSFGGSVRTLTVRPTFYLVKQRSNMRKNNIMYGYHLRTQRIGEPNFVMSTAEVATIFHFPIMTVRAPLVAKTESKKSEPPFRLPLQQLPTAPEAGMEALSTASVPPTAMPPFAPVSPVVPPPPSQRRIPAPPPHATPQPTQLHSMPGLPPGVRPVQQPTNTDGLEAPHERTAAPPASAASAVSTVDHSKSSPPNNLPFA